MTELVIIWPTKLAITVLILNKCKKNYWYTPKKICNTVIIGHVWCTWHANDRLTAIAIEPIVSAAVSAVVGLHFTPSCFVFAIHKNCGLKFRSSILFRKLRLTPAISYARAVTLDVIYVNGAQWLRSGHFCHCRLSNVTPPGTRHYVSTACREKKYRYSIILVESTKRPASISRRHSKLIC